MYGNGIYGFFPVYRDDVSKYILIVSSQKVGESAR
jgi:hypothetical protein